MRTTRLACLTLAAIMALGLWGCGSSRDSGPSSTPTVPVADAENVGNCTACHNIDVHTQVSGVAGQNADPGFGSTVKHDCEACHGGGQFHHGVGPIPYPSPTNERCGLCHSTQYDKVVASKHNAEDATNTEMIADGHDTRYCQRCHTAEGAIAFKDVVGEKDTLTNTIVANGDFVAPGQVEALPNEDAAGNPILHNVACAACHNPLTKSLMTAGWDPNQNGGSDQFDVCTSCHNYQLENGTIFGSGSAASGTATFYHDTAWYRAIPTTHYDNPTTLSGQGNEDLAAVPPVINKVEGYVIRQNSANPCFDCHGHELNTRTRPRSGVDDRDAPTIHTQWASSAHGGKIFAQKLAAAASFTTTGDAGDAPRTTAVVDAVQAAYTSDEVAPAWTHYNWDDTSSRGACQMCHTATGAANFMNDQADYDPANNDYSHLSGWSATGGSPQNELLYCWACHVSAESGALRTPGAITLAYQANGADITLPDMGNSNVCYNCHSGRGNMDNLIGANAADPAGPAVNGGTRTHYFASGATIYQSLTKVGYMYYDTTAGAFLNYSDPAYFGHDGVGCADCHMSADTFDGTASHTYDVVEKDATGVITNIAGTNCVTCHDGEHALFVSGSQVGQTLNIWNGTAAVPTVVTQADADAAAAELEHEAHGYHDAIDALGAVLTAAGTTPQAGYPYFSGSATDQGHGGAMHNWSYLHHEPGGFAHNRFYVKRLIFDSIDWLSNPTTGAIDAAGSRTLDGSIYLDPAVYSAAITWLGGDTATGIVATRP